VFADLVTALTLLTRLPVARFGGARFGGGTPDLARSIWAFPVVGFIVGAMGGLVYWVAYRLGMPPLLAAPWALAATLAATGAFHEDGLADTADGFGGGRTRERKMEIMRDSRIGSYGALALMLSLAMRIGAIASLGRPYLVVVALILAGMLGRAGMILTLILLRPARQDGMAASMADIPRSRATLGVALAAAAPFLLLSPGSAFAVVLSALAACWGMTKLAQAQIGGHSGDVLGAGEVIVECIVLTAIVCTLG
jgi:adenosylcobinamide-GDP ribazoletransferase